MHTALRYLSVLSFSFFTALSLPAAAQENMPSVPMVSGGVGEEDYDTLQSAKERYNVRILFSETNGAYLSDLAVTIITANGAEIASTTTQGRSCL